MNESAPFLLIIVFDVALSDRRCIFVDLIWPITHIPPEKKIALFFSFEVKLSIAVQY